MHTDFLDAIAELRRQTGQAHHKAFAATERADPDWPIWYDGYTRDVFSERFELNFSKSQLIYCLIEADIEHQARARRACGQNVSRRRS